MQPLEPAASRPRPSLRREWRETACLLLFFVVAAVAIVAWRDVPVIDDWTYAWSVEQLLEHGRMQVLDWSAVYPVGPALWGTAWSTVFGFSFVTLRVSTLVLSLGASAALYLILRELEASRRVALFGALSVAANPAFLLLSSSFMTDVPFVAFTLLALLCYVRAVRRGEIALLWWAGAWACVSCLDRQVGVLTPVAALPLLLQPNGRITRVAAAKVLAGTWVVMAAGSAFITWWLRPTGEMNKLVDSLTWLLRLPFATYVTYNLVSLSAIAFYALPALLAMATLRGLWRTRTAAFSVSGMAVVMAVFLGELPVPLRPSNTWTLTEVGGARQLISGEWPPFEAPIVVLVLRLCGLLAMSLAVLAVFRREAGHPQGASTRSTVPATALAVARELVLTPRGPLIVYLIAYLGLVNVLWFYNDRYLIVLLPLGVALALGHRAVERSEVSRLAWAMAALFAVIAIVGTRDTLRFNQAVRDTWQALVDSGVPPTDIDAGYAWTGWVLYAHPENLGPGLTDQDVPWVTSRRELAYKIAKAPVAGYAVVREVTWADLASWPGPDRLYVLKHQTALPPR